LAKDKRGGKREGAGRKPKSEELRLVEKLSPYEDDILTVIVRNAKAGEAAFVKMYMEYLHGKPKQQIETIGEGNKLTIEIVRTKGQTGTT
jgi:hypothetical protein